MGKNRREVILWAVDALNPQKIVRDRTALSLRHLQKYRGAEIIPVHVVSPTFARVGTAFHAPDPEEVRKSALESLQRYLKGVKLDGLAKPEVIESPNGRLRSRVGELLRFAKQRGATAIALSTHARKGAARFFLGSFAESLVTRSDIPLLVVNPKAYPHSGPVLFATDFSPKSLAALPDAIGMAKAAKCPILLFHHVPSPVQYFVEPVTSMTLFRQWQKEDAKEITKQASSCCDSISAQGVKASYALSTKGDSAADSILRTAKSSKARLIVLASEKDPVEAALLGSTARQVIRLSGCPVWVTHQFG